MNDDTLREKLSNLMADLMVDVSLKKLSKFDGSPVEKGRQYLEAHNGRLTLAIELVHQYAQAYCDSIIGHEQYPDKATDVTYEMMIRSGLRAEQRTLNNERGGKL